MRYKLSVAIHSLYPFVTFGSDDLVPGPSGEQGFVLRPFGPSRPMTCGCLTTLLTWKWPGCLDVLTLPVTVTFKTGRWRWIKYDRYPRCM